MIGELAKVRESLTPPPCDGLRIAWAPFAHPDAPSGYGVIAGKLAVALSQAGACVLDHTEFGWDVAVAVSLPSAWPFPGGARVRNAEALIPGTPIPMHQGSSKRRADLCWHTMFECDPIPTGWAEILNRCAAVWAPSTHSANLFRDAGVTAPIFISGYGVDASIFHPLRRKPAGDGPMKFLAWAPGFAGRKNLLGTIKAFLAAHLPEKDAVLEVKVNAGGGTPVLKDETGRVFSNVSVIEANWQASQVAEWLRSGDVLIYLSAGEGFGLQPLEAMACGVCAIVADNTGMQEYLRTDVALPVVCREKEISPIYSMRFAGGPFYQMVPSRDQAIAHIRWCFDHPIEAAKIGRAAAAYVADKWTWQIAGAKALAALQERFGDGRQG